MYETKEDRANQDAAVSAIERHLNCRIATLPHDMRVDWVLRGGADFRWVIGFAEFKRRSCHSSAFPDLLLSASKWRTGRRMAREHRVEFYIVVQWDDGIFIHTTTEHRPAIRTGGNAERTLEPCVFIPVEQFTRIQ